MVDSVEASARQVVWKHLVVLVVLVDLLRDSFPCWKCHRGCSCCRLVVGSVVALFVAKWMSCLVLLLVVAVELLDHSSSLVVSWVVAMVEAVVVLLVVWCP